MTEPFRTSVTIEAAPGDVFPYLVDADLIVKWMGEYAETEPIAGGLLHLDIIGVPVRGTFVTVEPPRRVVFTWGHAGSAMLPPGASTVEIVLTEHPGPRTVVELVHRDLPDEMAPGHARGWAHFVERLRIVGAGRNPGDDPWRHDPPPEARRAARK